MQLLGVYTGTTAAVTAWLTVKRHISGAGNDFLYSLLSSNFLVFFVNAAS